jgi:hypothetical protein
LSAEKFSDLRYGVHHFSSTRVVAKEWKGQTIDNLPRGLELKIRLLGCDSLEVAKAYADIGMMMLRGVQERGEERSEHLNNHLRKSHEISRSRSGCSAKGTYRWPSVTLTLEACAATKGTLKTHSFTPKKRMKCSQP